ncbi:hypothetical protein DFA_10970 [Cavenderia fasciculata]|uniref:Uncharacterized protein n=1 Tax=Cavenderia fasciculata TaxID=261658 RepID=F4QBX4_CACFS|nr:uncharacterized protein DFA_10970 [Cavenderia fasciculata]EGG14712.1 hypothetical protein DFA_10970 [Cavenderia fasciculata]|eukprot:XP_004351220.1 hypothetical protein DFA_10970 [Cavenderia fasciculata]
MMTTSTTTTTVGCTKIASSPSQNESSFFIVLLYSFVVVVVEMPKVKKVKVKKNIGFISDTKNTQFNEVLGLLQETPLSIKELFPQNHSLNNVIILTCTLSNDGLSHLPINNNNKKKKKKNNNNDNSKIFNEMEKEYNNQQKDNQDIDQDDDDDEEGVKIDKESIIKEIQSEEEKIAKTNSKSNFYLSLSIILKIPQLSTRSKLLEYADNRYGFSYSYKQASKVLYLSYNKIRQLAGSESLFVDFGLLLQHFGNHSAKFLWMQDCGDTCINDKSESAHQHFETVETVYEKRNEKDPLFDSFLSRPTTQFICWARESTDRQVQLGNGLLSQYVANLNNLNLIYQDRIDGLKLSAETKKKLEVIFGTEVVSSFNNSLSNRKQMEILLKDLKIGAFLSVAAFNRLTRNWSEYKDILIPLFIEKKIRLVIADPDMKALNICNPIIMDFGNQTISSIGSTESTATWKQVCEELANNFDRYYASSYEHGVYGSRGSSLNAHVKPHGPELNLKRCLIEDMSAYIQPDEWDKTKVVLLELSRTSFHGTLSSNDGDSATSQSQALNMLNANILNSHCQSLQRVGVMVHKTKVQVDTDTLESINSPLVNKIVELLKSFAKVICHGIAIDRLFRDANVLSTFFKHFEKKVLIVLLYPPTSYFKTIKSNKNQLIENLYLMNQFGRDETNLIGMEEYSNSLPQTIAEYSEMASDMLQDFDLEKTKSFPLYFPTPVTLENLPLILTGCQKSQQFRQCMSGTQYLAHFQSLKHTLGANTQSLLKLSEVGYSNSQFQNDQIYQKVLRASSASVTSHDGKENINRNCKSNFVDKNLNNINEYRTILNHYLQDEFKKTFTTGRRATIRIQPNNKTKSSKRPIIIDIDNEDLKILTIHHHQQQNSQ